MIISASRRTDIPAFYSEWLFNRLREGYVLAPNPYDPDRLGYVELSPKNVDCIVLWTKNPMPMLDKFRKLDEAGYPYCMHFTLTPYGRDIERHLPPKPKLLQTFREMSERIGIERSVWRYDPILVDTEHSIEWHLDSFERMCDVLRDHTERCFLSFVDPYKSLEDRFRALTENEMRDIASGFSDIARPHGIKLFTCAERMDLSRYGIEHGACIDKESIERIIGHRITAKNDANQRTECGCIESVDIGAYNTCAHGCSYCYAVSSRDSVSRRTAAHDVHSPVITGRPRGDETITDRTKGSQKDRQTDLSRYG